MKKHPKNSKKNIQKRKSKSEDYFYKMVIFLILGCFWIKLTFFAGLVVPIPIGLLFGLFLVKTGRLQIDKKIEYAVLLSAMLVGFWAPIGLYINL